MPGAPFVIAVGAEGLIRDAHVLAGCEDLAGMVEGVPGTAGAVVVIVRRPGGAGSRRRT